MAGSSVEIGKNEYLDYSGSYFLSEAVHSMNLGTLDATETSTTTNDYVIAGFFGRLGYNYKGRYIFKSNVRYDGSSVFVKISGIHHRIYSINPVDHRLPAFTDSESQT